MNDAVVSASLNPSYDVDGLTGYVGMYDVALSLVPV